MDKLRKFLNSMPVEMQIVFAANCRTSLSYLRKIISMEREPRADLAIAIDRNSRGAVTVEDVSPGIDWGYLRGTAKPTSKAKPVAKSVVDAATKAVKAARAPKLKAA